VVVRGQVVLGQQVDDQRGPRHVGQAGVVGPPRLAAERLGGTSESSHADEARVDEERSKHSSGTNGHENATLIDPEHAERFRSRWNELKGEFVDEPRDAVRKADALVGDVLDEIAKVFTEQRSRIEHDLDTDGTSTEDLRQALHRYRKFFERLLNI